MPFFLAIYKWYYHYIKRNYQFNNLPNRFFAFFLTVLSMQYGTGKESEALILLLSPLLFPIDRCSIILLLFSCHLTKKKKRIKRKVKSVFFLLLLIYSLVCSKNKTKRVFLKISFFFFFNFNNSFQSLLTKLHFCGKRASGFCKINFWCILEISCVGHRMLNVLNFDKDQTSVKFMQTTEHQNALNIRHFL